MLLATPNNLRHATDHLCAQDPILRPVIERAGPCLLRKHDEYYRALGDSIIGQQLSVKAAASIKHRFRELFGGVFPEPTAILNETDEALRSAGLSRAKAGYIRDLARHIVEGKISFTGLDGLSNEEIVTLLTDVKGIGEWTVHMFLMFCMGRLDILPVGDLGIRNGVRTLYGIKEMPTPQQLIAVAEKYKWYPYESVASWYIWHSLDNALA